MTIELNPVGVTCNLSCGYCYEHPMRDAGNFGPERYDMAAMKRGLEAQGSDFTIFGGEPLLMRIEDLEEMFRWGLEKFKKNGIQSNGALITDEHIELFLKYKVHVGISMDGPDELNDSRWAGSLDKTREMTERSQAALERMMDAGVSVSLIITLQRGNGLPAQRAQMKEWIRALDARGMRWARLHLLEVDHPIVGEKMDLTPDEATDFMLDMAAFEAELQLRFDAFSDMRKLLLGNDNDVTCIWNACDPYTTDAVQGVDGDGMSSNCGRATKEGVNWRKAEQHAYVRQVALYNTPYAYGGCQGCRFFTMCKGQCPGTAIDGDWRNRSAQCQTWMNLLGAVEQTLIREGKEPLSIHPIRGELEHFMVEEWSRGRNWSIANALKAMRGEAVAPRQQTPHGDHTDMALLDAPHGDQHGDVDHGDAPHGDYTDVNHPYRDIDHGDSPIRVRVGVEDR